MSLFCFVLFTFVLLFCFWFRGAWFYFCAICQWSSVIPSSGCFIHILIFSTISLSFLNLFYFFTLHYYSAPSFLLYTHIHTYFSFSFFATGVQVYSPGDCCFLIFVIVMLFFFYPTTHDLWDPGSQDTDQACGPEAGVLSLN